MPQVAAFAATAIAKAMVGFTAMKATTLGAFVIKAATLTALGAISAALTPQIGAGGSPLEWTPDTNAPLHVASGRFGAAGQVVFKDEWGQDNRLYSQAVVVAAAGPIKSLGGFKVDYIPASFDSGGVGTGRFAEAMWMDTQLGAQPESAALSPPTLSDHGAPVGWGENSRLSGKAGFFWTMVQNKDLDRYVGPLVPLWSDNEGCYVYDPRLDDTYPGGEGDCRLDDPDTWVWTECPILHGLKWALGHWESPDGKGAPGVGKKVCGMGVKPAGIHFESFVAQANIRDANGWKVTAYPSNTHSPMGVLEAYLQAGGAIYADFGGKVGCISRGAARAASITVTPADVLGDIELDRASPFVDRKNTLVPRYTSQAHDWEMVSLAPVTDADWLAQDNDDERIDGIDLPFVPDKDQAGQLTYLKIADTREPVRGVMTLRPYMMGLKPGAAFYLHDEGSDLDTLKCLCLKAAYDPKGNGWRISFVSETDAKYEAAGTVSPDAPPPSTYDPPDVTTAPAPDSSEWSLSGGVVGSGATLPALILEGDAANPYTIQIIVDHSTDGTTFVSPKVYGADAARIEYTGVAAGASLYAGVRYRTSWGATSDRLVLGPVTTGGLNAGTADEVPWTGVNDRPAELTDGRVAYQLAAELFPDPALTDPAVIGSASAGVTLETPEAITPPMASDKAIQLPVSASLTVAVTVPIEIGDESDILLSGAFAQVGAADAATSGRLRYQTWTGPGATGSLVHSAYVTLTATEDGRYSAVIPAAGAGVQSMWVLAYRNAGGLRAIQWGEITVRPVRTLPPELVFDDGEQMREGNLGERSRSRGGVVGASQLQSNGFTALFGGQPSERLEGNGAVISDLGFATPPSFQVLQDNFDAPAAGEYAKARVISQTASGGTVQAEWVNPGSSPVYTTRTDDGPGGLIGTPPAAALERTKALSGVAYNGLYTYTCEVQALVSAYNPLYNDPTALVPVQGSGRRGSGDPWTLGGTAYAVFTRPTSGPAQVLTVEVVFVCDFSQWTTWNTHAGSEYRVAQAGAPAFVSDVLIASFDGVTYQEQTGGTAASTRSALSGGRQARVIITPLGEA